MRTTPLTCAALACAVSAACAGLWKPAPVPALPESSAQSEARRFLDAYSQQFQKVFREAQLARWEAMAGGGETARDDAERRLMAFLGSLDAIETSQRLLAHARELDGSVVRQLESILYRAAEYPQTVPTLCRHRLVAEQAVAQRLQAARAGHACEDETPAADLEQRLAHWREMRRGGAEVRSNLAHLRDLRNDVVESLGYHDYFAYKSSDYGLRGDQMMLLLERLNREVRPLYRELHTWVRHELAARYDRPVPDLLPAHWLPDGRGRDWSRLAAGGDAALERALAGGSRRWVVEQAESFFTGLGFPPLPSEFWQRSSLEPAAVTRAAAWHIDLDGDVRARLGLEPTAPCFRATHREMGRVYSYLAHANPGVPLLLRRGACRALPEAVGALAAFAATRPATLAEAGLVPGGREQPVEALLAEALEYVVLLPYAAGVVARFEHDLYAVELPESEWNRRWWELAERVQGVAPPLGREPQMCDAAAEPAIVERPAELYDQAIAAVLLFQLHDHIARVTLAEDDPRSTSYYRRRDAGEVLRRLMAPGATVDWRELLRQVTGEEPSARAMVEYFQPLHDWLVEENRGRRHVLAEL